MCAGANGNRFPSTTTTAGSQVTYKQQLRKSGQTAPISNLHPLPLARRASFNSPATHDGSCVATLTLKANRRNRRFPAFQVANKKSDPSATNTPLPTLVSWFGFQALAHLETNVIIPKLEMRSNPPQKATLPPAFCHELQAPFQNRAHLFRPFRSAGVLEGRADDDADQLVFGGAPAGHGPMQRGGTALGPLHGLKLQDLLVAEGRLRLLRPETTSLQKWVQRAVGDTFGRRQFRQSGWAVVCSNFLGAAGSF